jgi:hypothetical protein
MKRRGSARRRSIDDRKVSCGRRVADRVVRFASLQASAASCRRHGAPISASAVVRESPDGPRIVAEWTVRHRFWRGAIVCMGARRAADPNRLLPIRPIPIAMGVLTTRFREVVQKNFLYRFIDESDAIPAS